MRTIEVPEKGCCTEDECCEAFFHFPFKQLMMCGIHHRESWAEFEAIVRAGRKPPWCKARRVRIEEEGDE